MTDIFISYARADDEPFVKRLYEDLTKRGFDVWWDRVSMPSRALTFLQEIRDAIDSADRLILVVGPKAVESDYVSAEWQYALRACKVVTPILRLGDYVLVPDDLSKLHCQDFRETCSYDDALTELLRILGEPVAPLGALRVVPSLPPHFLSRPEEMPPLRDTVLADVNRPVVVTSAKQTTALQGMGGVGKSVLAAAFARTCETRRAFTDGIIWLRFGQQPDLVRNLALVGQAFDDDPQHYLDLPRGKARLAEVLADKVCLLVLDDIWDVAHAEAFVNALGPRCRLLITTRDGGLATALGAQEHRLDVLSDKAALMLLADWAKQSVEALPPEARDVADECGNLPFALALCGAMARDGIPWADLLDALREADLTFIEQQFPNYPYPDVLKSLKVSVDALARSNPAWEKHYLELAVFPAEAVPEAAVMTLWLHTNGLNKRSARKLLTTLERKALLRLEGEAPERRVTLHDLQHDYVRAAQGDLTDLHGELLEAYRQKCPDGWPTGPDDGYFFEQLAYHLVEARRGEELRALLFDFDWLQAKLEATEVNALVTDYDFLPDDADLRRVQGAIRLAAHVLAQDKTQLAGQLLGRLMTQEAPDIQTMLEQAKEWRAASWLRPLTPGLTPPGGPLIRTLQGHTNLVNAVAVTPDGRRAVSASSDRTLKVWDLESGQVLRTLEGHSSRVNAVATFADGKRVISAAWDNTLRVWDLESGQVLRTLEGHTSSVNAVAIFADGRRAVSASSDHTLKVWDLESGQVLRTLEGHTGSVEAVAVFANGQRAISASNDGTLKVWDLESGQKLCNLESYGDMIHSVTVSADGRWAISGGLGGILKVWDLERRQVLQTLMGHTSSVASVVIFADGQRAISASLDDTLKLWDLESGKELCTLPGHTGGVGAVAVFAGGRRAISASGDTTLRVWDLESDQEIPTSQGHTLRVEGVAVFPNGRRAISASWDNTLKVWDLESGQELQTLTGHTGWVNAVTVYADGRRAISASWDNTLIVWDLDSGQAIHTLHGHSERVSAMEVFAEGQRAVSASGDNTLKIWDLVNGQVLHSLVGHKGPVEAVAVFSDGQRAISASEDNTLVVWDIEHGRKLVTLRGHTDRVCAVKAFADRQRAISASWDKTLRVWELESGQVLQSLEGHTDLVYEVELLSNEQHAISGSRDSTLKVWDLESGQELCTLKGHSREIAAIAMFADGRRAVSASWDKTLKVWDLERGVALATFNGDAHFLTCALTPDEQTLVAGDGYGRVYILRLEGME